PRGDGRGAKILCAPLGALNIFLRSLHARRRSVLCTADKCASRARGLKEDYKYIKRRLGQNGQTAKSLFHHIKAHGIRATGVARIPSQRCPYTESALPVYRVSVARIPSQRCPYTESVFRFLWGLACVR